MMALKNYHIALLLFFFTLLGFSQQQLGYKLTSGLTFKIKQVANQEMVMKIENSEQIITNEMEALFLFVVDGKDVDHYDISFEFIDFAMKSTSNLQGVIMDVRASEPVEGDITSTIFNGLLGTHLQMKMKENGKILSVTGADKLIDKMIETVGDLDDFTKNLMRESLAKDFSSESLSGSFEQMTFIYPDEPVAVNDTWTNEFKGKVDAKNDWLLEKIEARMVSISGQSAITVDAVDSSLSMSLSGSQEILVQAFEESGFIKNMIIKGATEGISTMGMAAGVEIPTTLNQTITYELIEE